MAVLSYRILPPGLGSSKVQLEIKASLARLDVPGQALDGQQIKVMLRSSFPSWIPRDSVLSSVHICDRQYCILLQYTEKNYAGLQHVIAASKLNFRNSSYSFESLQTSNHQHVHGKRRINEKIQKAERFPSTGFVLCAPHQHHIKKVM